MASKYEHVFSPITIRGISSADISDIRTALAPVPGRCLSGFGWTAAVPV